jgi:hypothetical protein
MPEHNHILNNCETNNGIHFGAESEPENGNIHSALLAVIENALQNNPAVAHAFATLMWMVGEAATKNPKEEKLVAKIVNDSIGLAYLYTSDHRADHGAGLERYRRVLGDEWVS